MEDFIISGKKYKSRLILGTGKYKSFEETAKAINAAEVEIVTVAVRRVNVTNPKEPMLVDFLDPKKITYLPNTAGCYTAEEALRTLRLARDAGGWNLVKLEVLGDKETLYPNMIETIDALKVLKKENFDVMVYSSDDPILCKQLEDMGAAAIMPLGSLIGSGRGIQNRFNISIIKNQAKVPVIVDAGIGCASDAAIAMDASKKTAAKAARGLRVEGGAAEDTTKFLNPLCRPSVGGRAPGAREKRVTTLTCGGHGHVTRGFHTPGQGSGFPPRLEMPAEPVLTEGDVVHERPAHSDAVVHIA